MWRRRSTKEAARGEGGGSEKRKSLFRRLLAMPGLSGFFILNNPIQGMGIDCEELRDFLSGIEVNGLSDRGVAGIRVAEFPMILPGFCWLDLESFCC